MKKSVVFKIRAFPVVSQTFITSCIIEAIKNGYSVSIIADQRNDLKESSQEDLLKRYHLMERLMVPQSPQQKMKRLSSAFFLFLNPVLFYYFIRYCLLQGKISLSYLFTLKFYSPIRKVPTYHVHFANFVSPLFELKKIGFLSSNIVVTFHGAEAHLLPGGDQLKKLRADFETYATHLTVNSGYLKKVLVERGFNKNLIKIVPVGIDVNFFQMNNAVKNWHQEEFKLITIGRLVTYKSQKLGIEVVGILKGKGYNVNYTILGSGSEYENLDNYRNELGLQKCVDLLSSKNQSEIKELLRRHHAFLMTSTVDIKGRREAFGVVSLEAQAMGLPVVGFNSGGFPETVYNGSTGFIVPEGNVLEMSKAVEKFINDRDLWRQMSQNARVFVEENFSIFNTNKKYLELY